MRDTVEAFEARTGRVVQPMIGGRPFRRDEAVPTLFRYPGPCGLERALGPGIRYLGPAESPTTLLSAVPVHADAAGAPVFGTLAVLQPLWLNPAIEAEDPLVVAIANHAVPADAAIAWIPPGSLHVDLEGAREPDDVRRRIRGYDGSRARMREIVAAYLDELAAMAAAGAPGPGRSWCAVPEEERRSWLDRWGVLPRWTSRHRTLSVAA